MLDSQMISCLEGVAEGVGVEVGVAPEGAGLPGATVVAGVGAGAGVGAVAEADLTHKLCMLSAYITWGFKEQDMCACHGV